MHCYVLFLEDPLENEMLHPKGFILFSFEINKYIRMNISISWFGTDINQKVFFFSL